MQLRLPSGDRVQVWIDAPTNHAGERTVAIIVPGTFVNDRHGGPDRIYDALTKALNENGLHVARFDPKLIATDHAAPSGTPGAVSIATQKIILEELVHLLRRRDSNFSKIVFIGHSQGSFLAAQVVSGNPALVDGFFSYGMSIRPLRQATEYSALSLPLAILRNIVDSGAGNCMPNDVVREQVIARGLLGFRGPVEFWLSSKGSWCKNDLSEFASKMADQRAFSALLDECKQGQEKPSTNSGNSCEQLLFFATNESLQSLLGNLTVPVGIAMGKNDPLLDLPTELVSYLKHVAKGGTWRFVVLDGVGHGFGRKLVDGPAEPAALDELARFVHTTLTDQHRP